MHFNDHNPPHFHAKYGRRKAIIGIENFNLIEGNLPPRVLTLVIEWAGLHKQELLKNWNDLLLIGEFKKIKPLI